MLDEPLSDVVLDALMEVDDALTTNEVREYLDNEFTLTDVRRALRDLAEQGEVARLDQDYWRTIVPVTPGAIATSGPTKAFSEEELSRARQKWGTTKSCPHCLKEGDIDLEFGWRRMVRSAPDLNPQSYCRVCRPQRGAR